MLLGLLIWSAQPASAEIVDRIAAVVNREVITLSELYELGGDYIEQAALGSGPDNPSRRGAELRVLDELITRALITQEIEELNLSVTAEEIDRAIDDIARQNGVDRSRLRSEVERSGLQWDTYRTGLSQELETLKFNQVVIQPRITVSEDELIDLYNRMARDETVLGRRVVRGIFLRSGAEDTDEIRDALLAQLVSAKVRLGDGETWDVVDADYPESVYASTAGDMGAFAQGELVEALDQVVFSLEVGATADPVQVPGGFMLLNVAGVEIQEAPPFESMRDQLQQQVAAQKIEEETELWLVQARRRASIEIKLEEGS